MQLGGIHHLTAISAKPAENLAFYTGLLGMRLVKKTVNQDDVSAYHLFYADGRANPGTDLTFFDFPAAPERRGTNSISRTGLRSHGDAVPLPPSSISTSRWPSPSSNGSVSRPSTSTTSPAAAPAKRRWATGGIA